MNSFSFLKSCFLLILILIAISACSPKTVKVTSDVSVASLPKADSIPMPSLEGTYWKITELYGSSVKDENPKRGGFIQFRANGEMTASAGCNSLTGTYTQKPDMGISFGTGMATTLIGCPNQAREDQLKKALAEVNTYQLTGIRLQLSVGDGAPAIRLERVMEK